ncbi:MAG: bifunctional nicotinamidase/pyrazinamidase [Treponema sp.]|jgi:nicotinamidase/pyrazinamidase|nr:bifunctional nicotinamidase/pyrazinamidase [Treponema sp.]
MEKEAVMLVNLSRTALIEIDVQNDFCPSYTLSSGEKLPPGALAVKGGDEVIEPLNNLALAFAGAGARVVATADWHPPGHVSFARAHPGKNAGETVELPGTGPQVLWPDHCVRGSRGAAFHEKLDLRPASLIIHKGFRQSLDSYSAFFENDRRTPTGLEAYLKSLGIDTVLMGGLATDYCVLYSALDAAALGFTAVVLTDAVRGVGIPAGSVDAALDRMKSAGVQLIPSTHIVPGA